MKTEHLNWILNQARISELKMFWTWFLVEHEMPQDSTQLANDIERHLLERIQELEKNGKIR